MIETTSNKKVFVVGSSKEYNFDIPFFTPSDIHCYVYDGVSETELVRVQDFEVEVKEDYSHGAKITLSAAIPMGRKLTIAREVPLTQDVKLPEYGKLPTTSLEAQLDKVIMICQQLKEITARSFAVPHGMDNYNNDEIYEAFRDLVYNAETWAEEAQTGATNALSSANAAAGSSNTARSHASSAANAASNAVSAAGSAANAASNALSAAENIRAIAQQATLNHVTLIFGDWGSDGMYITYNEWTDAVSLTTVDEKIGAHNESATAHGAAIGAHNGSETAHDDIRKNLSTHASSETAHDDIRSSVTAVNNRFNNDEIRALANTRCWISPPITPTSGTRSKVDHNLNLSADELARAIVEVRLKCVTENMVNGYKVGDYAQWGMKNSDFYSPVQPLLEANTVSVITGSIGISLVNKNDGSTVQATLSQWRYEFRIWY